MPSYHFKAIDASGGMVTGAVEAAGLEAAALALRNDGRFVIDLRADRGGLTWLAWRREKQGKHADLNLMVQKLSVLLQAELPLDRALSLAIGSAPTGWTTTKFREIQESVRQGRHFADAAEEAGIPLPKMAFAMIRAGEASGHIGTSLAQLSEYLQSTQALRERIQSALIYPILILVTAGLSLSFILTYVLPQFRPLFAEAGATLPLSTQIVMAIGNTIARWGWAMAGAMAILAFWFRARLKDPASRRFWHGKLLQIPVLGGLITSIAAARFSRTLGTLVIAGVPLPAAVSMSSAAISNAAIADPLAAAATNLREGEALGEMIKRTNVLPPLAFQLVQVGEESGRLGDMLLRQATMFDQEVERTITRLLAALVPALTIILGIIVAGIVASILAAVLQIDTLAR